MNKILIQNGRLIDVANQIDGIMDIAIENGKIAHVGDIPTQFVAQKIINATDRWVVPGLIDLCCRAQMPHPQGTTLQHEAHAALKRGFTGLCLPPDGSPITNNQQNEAMPRIYPIGALTTQLAGQAIADLTALHQAGCIAFSNATQPIPDLNMLRHCYEYAASFDLLLIVHPFDAALAKNGVAHEGIVATRLGLAPIPVLAETISLAQHLQFSKEFGVRVHFTCLSSYESVCQIKEAKAQKLKISADVSMHQLHLTEMDVAYFDANCHLYPPLRSLRDKEALLQGVNDGTIDAICSDHRPLDRIAKLAPFANTVPGLSAIDTFLSLGIHLVGQNKLELKALLKAITYHPAQLLGLATGNLAIDSDADLCIIDPKCYWTVAEDTLYSNGKNTPFMGWELPGVVTQTILKGFVI
ncbi:MAG: amidohydrolase family protein [Proteobacteria bacterium]|nr:amidohydrolase family protein [Pseudomonadota bacterium]